MYLLHSSNNNTITVFRFSEITTMLPCPPNMVYGDPACVPTCEDPVSKTGCNPAVTTSILTCVCTDGFLWNGSYCVTDDQCGCYLPSVGIIEVKMRFKIKCKSVYCTQIHLYWMTVLVNCFQLAWPPPPPPRLCACVTISSRREIFTGGSKTRLMCQTLVSIGKYTHLTKQALPSWMVSHFSHQ